MKSFTTLLLTLALCFVLQPEVNAQDDDLFENGSVFQITMIRTNANSQDTYLESLNQFYIPMMHQAQSEGLIKSFRVLRGDFANQKDYDVMMLVEFENMAAFDDNAKRDAKWEAIQKSLSEKIGGDDELEALTQSYPNIRTYVGTKLMREAVLKK